MNTLLRVASYNIHKGFSHFNRRMVIHDLRARLRALDSDIVFLQEVQGSHSGHAQRWQQWPNAPQHEFLADEKWSNCVYGKNAVYDLGHHGNAILSRYPIIHWENLDISDHAFESRGLLHAVIEMPDMSPQLHVFCLHLALFERSRKRQLDLVYESVHGQVARSFPASLPILSLDRIYVRGWQVRQAEVVGHLDGWHRSDHAALVAMLEVPGAADQHISRGKSVQR